MAKKNTNCVCFLSASRQAGFVHPAGALRAPRKNGFPCGNALSFPRSTGPSGRPSLARAPRRPFHLPRSGSPPRCGSVPRMHASAFQNTRFPSPKTPAIHAVSTFSTLSDEGDVRDCRCRSHHQSDQHRLDPVSTNTLAVGSLSATDFVALGRCFPAVSVGSPSNSLALTNARFALKRTGS